MNILEELLNECKLYYKIDLDFDADWYRVRDQRVHNKSTHNVTIGYVNDPNEDLFIIDNYIDDPLVYVDIDEVKKYLFSKFKGKKINDLVDE